MSLTEGTNLRKKYELAKHKKPLKKVVCCECSSQLDPEIA